MTIISNLTPHQITVYGPECPDVISTDDPAWLPVHVIEPSGTVARLEHVDRWAVEIPGCDIPVRGVDYRSAVGLPDSVEGTYYVVSLQLAQTLVGQRGDLLVPYAHVRNTAGAVVGCRALALPLAAGAHTPECVAVWANFRAASRAAQEAYPATQDAYPSEAYESACAAYLAALDAHVAARAACPAQH